MAGALEHILFQGVGISEGVPYILVDGKPVEQPNDLLKEVCKAYQGQTPKACNESNAPTVTNFLYA